jgi:O-antigen chain-terminating methyltransferase
MNDTFYKAFEDKYRGSTQEINERLEFYAPFLERLASHFPGEPCLDLGSGRGEWLTILKRFGFNAQGADLNKDMVLMCQSAGHHVVLADVIEALKSASDHSLVLVSAFHLVEHLSSDALGSLISEAHRKLKPGGLLVMETPNPENFSVGAFKFYMDPTHIRPIHPLFLKFLSEHSGFTNTTIVRLQEWKRLHTQKELGLFDVLWGSSADYAVIAQKNTDTFHDEALIKLLSTEFGISSESIAQRYDRNLQEQLKTINQLITEHSEQLLALQKTPTFQAQRFMKRIIARLKKRMQYITNL